MPHLALRAPRVGYALVLLTACLGSASGAPTPELAASSDRTAARQLAPTYPTPTQSVSAQPATIAVAIPCVAGTCEMRIPAPPADEPVRTRPIQQTPAPALAQR